MLLGAADRRWDDAVMAVRGSPGAKRDATTATVRAALGAPAFAALHIAGSHLRLEEALALALTIAVPPGQLAASCAVPLTDRQVAVLRLLIAASLFLSRRTVQDHVSHLLANQGANAAWTRKAFSIPAGVLVAGTNELSVSNLEPTEDFSTPPWVLLGDTVIEIN